MPPRPPAIVQMRKVLALPRIGRRDITGQGQLVLRFACGGWARGGTRGSGLVVVPEPLVCRPGAAAINCARRMAVAVAVALAWPEGTDTRRRSRRWPGRGGQAQAAQARCAQGAAGCRAPRGGQPDRQGAGLWRGMSHRQGTQCQTGRQDARQAGPGREGGTPDWRDADWRGGTPEWRAMRDRGAERRTDRVR